MNSRDNLAGITLTALKQGLAPTTSWGVLKIAIGVNKLYESIFNQIKSVADKGGRFLIPVAAPFRCGKTLTLNYLYAKLDEDLVKAGLKPLITLVDLTPVKDINRISWKDLYTEFLYNMISGENEFPEVLLSFADRIYDLYDGNVNETKEYLRRMFGSKQVAEVLLTIVRKHRIQRDASEDLKKFIDLIKFRAVCQEMNDIEAFSCLEQLLRYIEKEKLYDIVVILIDELDTLVTVSSEIRKAFFEKLISLIERGDIDKLVILCAVTTESLRAFMQEYPRLKRWETRVWEVPNFKEEHVSELFHKIKELFIEIYPERRMIIENIDVDSSYMEEWLRFKTKAEVIQQIINYMEDKLKPPPPLPLPINPDEVKTKIISLGNSAFKFPEIDIGKRLEEGIYKLLYGLARLKVFDEMPERNCLVEGIPKREKRVDFKIRYKMKSVGIQVEYTTTKECIGIAEVRPILFGLGSGKFDYGIFIVGGKPSRFASTIYEERKGLEGKFNIMFLASENIRFLVGVGSLPSSLEGAVMYPDQKEEYRTLLWDNFIMLKINELKQELDDLINGAIFVKIKRDGSIEKVRGESKLKGISSWIKEK